jgi:hypothetical protein
MSKEIQIPTIRVYLRLICDIASQESSMLEADEYQISTDGKATIYHRISRGRGGSFQPPFIASKIGFELFEYDPDLFDHWVDQLFVELKANAPLIMKQMALKSASSSFIININIQDKDQQPMFFLSPEQVELLASFGASINLDGYLMYSSSDDSDD